jgi:predicted GIY-YIG superfamily endonuclease
MKKFVYLIKSDNGEYKIGVSKNPNKRLKQLNCGNPFNSEIIHQFETEIPHKVETALHNFYSMNKINREWYDLPIEVHFDFLEICAKIEKNLKIVAENS